MLAREAGAPVKLEFSRKNDFVGMHGRWPTVQYYKVGVKNDGRLTAIQLRTIRPRPVDRLFVFRSMSLGAKIFPVR